MRTQKAASRKNILRAFATVPLALILAALIPSAILAQSGGAPGPAASEAPPASVSVYTATGATTAALPLLVALRDGWPGVKADVTEWKNLDDLRALLLAGKGDVWVGHLDAFARAAYRGAPVRLVSVTAWKKFWFVSAPLPLDEGKDPRPPADIAELAGYLSKNDLTLTTSPQGGPGPDLLAAIAASGGPAFKASTFPGQQAALELSTGRAVAALLPEPLVSMALLKNPKLVVVGSLEEEFAEAMGGLPRLPQAGVGVNSAFAKAHPKLSQGLQGALTAAGDKIKDLPAYELVGLLPKSTRDALGDKALELSFGRDPIIVQNAKDVAPEIERFLCWTAGDLCGSGRLDANFPPDFLF
ncbi:MAG: hypothetical protein LBF40_07990 [Deltaproteobacteria bacterium]|nr:hypothetical protein [Deltaproteobacteria bacterium]